jgi:hypothetical protein
VPLESAAIGRSRENHAHGGALAGLAVHFQPGVLTLEHSVYRRQSEAGAAFALGGEKGSRQRRRVSSSMPMPVSMTSMLTAGRRFAVDGLRAQRQHAAFGHGVHGIEHQVGEGVAQLDFVADHVGQGVRQFPAQLNLDAAFLRQRAPAWLVSSSTWSMAPCTSSLRKARVASRGR